jgi:replicative DNA helicase
MKNAVQSPDMTSEIERAALAMFYEGVEIPGYINAEMFLLQKNKILFSALKQLKADGKTPDLRMLNTWVVNHKANEQVETAYIAEISNMIPSTANSQFYLD